MTDPTLAALKAAIEQLPRYEMTDIIYRDKRHEPDTKMLPNEHGEYVRRSDVLRVLDAQAGEPAPLTVYAVREYCDADFDGDWVTVALWATHEQAADDAESRRRDNYRTDVEPMVVLTSAPKEPPR